MNKPVDYSEINCADCASGKELGFEISMAFQPIVSATQRKVISYEALVRGINNEPAGVIFERVNKNNLYRFDQSCRVKAIQLAAKLFIPCLLNINFMPNAVYRPELCIRTTLAAAQEYGFPTERIVFEVTEGEQIDDYEHLHSILTHYNERGFKTAIDDFGAGYAGLNLLAEFQTNIVKIDMALVRDIHKIRSKLAIVHGIFQMCHDLKIDVIAEGIENREEYLALRMLGIEYFQGYYFAKPAFESIEQVDPDLFLGE